MSPDNIGLEADEANIVIRFEFWNVTDWDKGLNLGVGELEAAMVKLPFVTSQNSIGII